MTHTEINRRLALAIGYEPEDVKVDRGLCFVCYGLSGVWRCFDYLCLGTIYPIAEKYKLMPQWNSFSGKWTIFRQVPAGRSPLSIANTCPRACIALAVIAANGRGLLT